MTEEALGQNCSTIRVVWGKHLSIICTVVQSQKRRCLGCAMNLADWSAPHHLEVLSQGK